jgi:hypothetical protein
MREEQTLAEIEDYLEGFNQPTHRGMRVTARGSLPGHPEMGGPAIAGGMRSGYNRMPARKTRRGGRFPPLTGHGSGREGSLFGFFRLNKSHSALNPGHHL